MKRRSPYEHIRRLKSGRRIRVSGRKKKKVLRRMAWDIEEAKKRFAQAELVEMTPRDFLDRSLPLLDKDEKGRIVYGFTGRRLTSKEESEFLSKPTITDKGEFRRGTLSELGDLITSKSTKVTVPFFTKDDHEGRHRAKAAELKGVKKMPVLIVEDV